jgi:hypothetical protein
MSGTITFIAIPGRKKCSDANACKYFQDFPACFGFLQVASDGVRYLSE